MTDHERVQERLRAFDALPASEAQQSLTRWERDLTLALYDTDQFATMHDADRAAAAVGAWLNDMHLLQLVAERQP